jgi:hypothetical protein
MKIDENKITVWTCNLCGGVVAAKLVNGGRDFGPVLAELPESCKLKEHSIGNECIAFRDQARAIELLEAEEIAPL